MASPVYQTKSSPVPFNNEAVAVSVPSGTTNGDLLLWFTFIGGAASPVPTLSFDSGWTQIDALAAETAATGWDVRYRVASSEPSSYNVSQTNAGYWASVSYMVRISGIGGSPIAGTATKTSETSSSTLTIPDVTSSETDTLLITLCQERYENNRTISAAGGLTQLHQQDSYNRSLVCYEAISASGNVTGRTNTVVASGTFSKWAFLISSGASGGSSIAADQGSFSLTGQSANLLLGRTLAADSGSFTVSGQDVTLTKTTAYSITADYGSFSLAGQDVAFQKTDAGSYVLTAEVGLFSLVGQGALASYSMNAEIGSFVIAGQEVTFSIGVPAAYSLTADAGSYSLTGQNARLDWSGAPIVPNRQTGIYMGMRIGL